MTYKGKGDHQREDCLSFRFIRVALGQKLKKKKKKTLLQRAKDESWKLTP